MNKKLHIVFALSVLFAAMPVKPISHRVAVGLTALSAAVYFLGFKMVLDDVQGSSQKNAVTVPIAGIGSLAGTSATYWALYKLTPDGRYDRANDIVEKLKDRFPRFFTATATTSIEQILHDLGAFNESHTNNRNFAFLNALQELDSITNKLKKAESLLFAAKKDISPEVFEQCKVSVSKLYAQLHAKITNNSVADVAEAKNHQEIEVKINDLLSQIQTMLNQVTELYSYIHFHGPKEYKQQLKEYEELRAARAQSTKVEIISVAIPTATIAASVAVVTVASALAYRAVQIGQIIGRAAPRIPVAEEYTY